MKKLFQTFSIFFALAVSVQAQVTVSVADFGLKPDTRENAVPYIQKALAHCKANGVSTLTFPYGRYDFWPHHCIERDYFESNTSDINPKRLAVLIENFGELTVDGNGSDFVF
ncbi:MAG: alpha-1,3-galactosidase B, partial [Tannerella sp.]|nr:alpha-1,3-galactosidase B [Tannerella sp.]